MRTRRTRHNEIRIESLGINVNVQLVDVCIR